MQNAQRERRGALLDVHPEGTPLNRQKSLNSPIS
jgi:hypothetical protein